VTWQASVLVLLAASLVCGAVWYERSRPRAQIVALVAALAALAAAGRVALAPIPNVVPTTDIALISGFALGGAPGFAVGSLAALVSNLWLGQGPWTPWQMAGWGMTGVAGAALAAATGRRAGRIVLAAACGLCGLAFGGLLDLSLMVTYGGEQSLERYLAISSRSLPFNVAHAAGNVVFALAAGPALARMLLRYRERFEHAWARPSPAGPADGVGRRRRAAAGAGAACLLAALVFAASPASRAVGTPAASSAAAGKSGAVEWLRDAQNEDGGFGPERGSDSNPAMTGWVALALESAGLHPGAVTNGGSSALDYLRANAGEIGTSGDMQRTILVLAAAGEDPRRFEGRDLVERLLNRRGENGSWGGQVNATAFGVLALKAAGRPGGNARSASWLRAAANGDGGWGFVPGSASDPDSTGAALQALGVAPGGGGASSSGVSYLRGAQRGSGGFALRGGFVNSQSTAWAVQGLLAAGVKPARVRSGGRSGLSYLAARQAADGHYRYSAQSDQTPVWVTAQALLAVSGSAFPLDRVLDPSGSSPDPGAGPAPVAAGTGSSGATPGISSGSSTDPAGGGPTPAAGAGGVAGAVADSPSAAVPSDPAVLRGDPDGDSTFPLVAGIAACAAIALGGAALMGRRREDPQPRG
jgi:energy-coupling factor transport system substrate-specific component